MEPKSSSQITFSFPKRAILRFKFERIHQRTVSRIQSNTTFAYMFFLKKDQRLRFGFPSENSSHDVFFTQKNYNLKSCECFNYPNHQYQSQLDCIDDKKQKLIYDYFRCFNTIFPTNVDHLNDLNSPSNQFCLFNQTKTNQIILHQRFENIYSRECKPNCLRETFSYTTRKYKSLYQNESSVNIIPTESPFIRYILTPKSDFDQLIYNLGGLAGLWLGLSAYASLMRVFLLLLKLKQKLVNQFMSYFVNKNLIVKTKSRPNNRRIRRRKDIILKVRSS